MNQWWMWTDFSRTRLHTKKKKRTYKKNGLVLPPCTILQEIITHGTDLTCNSTYISSQRGYVFHHSLTLFTSHPSLQPCFYLSNLSHDMLDASDLHTVAWRFFECPSISAMAGWQCLVELWVHELTSPWDSASTADWLQATPAIAPRRFCGGIWGSPLEAKGQQRSTGMSLWSQGLHMNITLYCLLECQPRRKSKSAAKPLLQ